MKTSTHMIDIQTLPSEVYDYFIDQAFDLDEGKTLGSLDEKKIRLDKNAEDIRYQYTLGNVPSGVASLYDLFELKKTTVELTVKRYEIVGLTLQEIR